MEQENGQGRRRSQQIIWREKVKAAGSEENRLILRGGNLCRRLRRGGLRVFSKPLEYDNLTYVHWSSRFYKKTRNGFFILNQGFHNRFEEYTERKD